MLSYRHLYHAGNFADVVKHTVLGLLLQSLHRKHSPFLFLDTHAGAGRYDLNSEAAQKTAEYRLGIARIWPQADSPAPVTSYLDAVRAINDSGAELPRYYPGSPRIARNFLRPQDRMVLTELNRHDCEDLAREFSGDAQTTVRNEDGYQALKAFLPPAERRGLVLIDPSYELKDEYERLTTGLQEAWRRWPTGIYAIWYPILSRSLASRLHKAMAETGIHKILCAELTIQRDTVRTRLNGTGMLIVNPPWQLDEQLTTLLPWLWEHLAVEKQSGTRVEWLVPE